MAVVRLILRLSSSRPRPLAAVPALLRLVVRSSPSAQAPRKPLHNANIGVATLSERAQARGVARATRRTPSAALSPKRRPPGPRR